MKLTAKKPTSYIQLKTMYKITVNAYSKNVNKTKFLSLFLNVCSVAAFLVNQTIKSAFKDGTHGP